MTGVISIESADYAVFERELYVTIHLVRSGDISKNAKVTFVTTDGTAKAGVDYGGMTGSVDFGGSVSTLTVTVPIIDDQADRPDKTFTFDLISADETSTIEGTHTANISILDDDFAPGEPPDPNALTPLYQVKATQIGPNSWYPIALTFLPDSTEALLATKQGVIQSIDIADPDRKPRTVLDIHTQVNSRGDRGLMGFALHPDLANHPYLYVFYVVDPPETQENTGLAGRNGFGNRYSYLSRFTLDRSGPELTIDAGSEVVLLGAAGRSLSDISGGGAINFTEDAHQTEPASNLNPDGTYRRDYIKVDSQTHAGGAVAFGPDGALYVSTGDGSSYEYADPRALNVQDIDSLNGKILRIDPLTGDGLADNPYATADLGENRSKVWARGLRNPYTMTFTPDGQLLVSETGWNMWEEINAITKGANYGWPLFEGGDGGELNRTLQYEDLPDLVPYYAEVQRGERHVSPAYRGFYHYSREYGYQLGCIVGASSIYWGDKYPAPFQNDYFFTDVVTGEIYAIDANDPTEVMFVTDLGEAGPTSFVAGPDGYMYIVDLATNRLLRLEITAFPDAP